MDFRYQRHFKATRGEHGMSKNQHGRNAEDMVVKVPPGTVVIDDDTKQVIADLTEHGQEAVIAKGDAADGAIPGSLRLPTRRRSFLKTASPARSAISFSS